MARSSRDSARIGASRLRKGREEAILLPAVHTPSLARLRSCWALHPHLPPRLQVSTWQPSCVSHAGGARRREPTPSHRVEWAWPWVICCYGLHGMARAAHAKHTIVIISNNSPKNFLLRALRARSYTPPGCNLRIILRLRLVGSSRGAGASMIARDELIRGRRVGRSGCCRP